MPKLARTWLGSLAVVFALTVGFGASALATTRLDGNGELVAQAPKGSHKPNPNATPTPTPVPTKKPVATPKPTPRPTLRPTAAPVATPRPRQRPTPTLAPPAVTATASPSLATQAAALTSTDRRDPGTHVSVLAIGQEPLTIAVSIVAIAGVALLAAWVLLGRRRAILLWVAALLPAASAKLALRPALRRGPKAPAPVPAGPAAPAEPGRKKRGARSGGADAGDRRSGHLDDVFAGSSMRRVVQQDHVQLLNVPSGAFGTPLTELGSGREVKVLERHESWAKVRTPWGEEGWLPESVLGT